MRTPQRSQGSQAPLPSRMRTPQRSQTPLLSRMMRRPPQRSQAPLPSRTPQRSQAPLPSSLEAPAIADASSAAKPDTLATQGSEAIKAAADGDVSNKEMPAKAAAEPVTGNAKAKEAKAKQIPQPSGWMQMQHQMQKSRRLNGSGKVNFLLLP